MNNNIVFVYGTLKFGYGNHRLISDQRFLGDGTTIEKYPMYDAGPFPYMVNMPGEGKNVYGELYSVDDDAVKRLDMLEGVPSHYYKSKIKVKNIEDNRIYEAYTYFETYPPEDVLVYDLISEFV